MQGTPYGRYELLRKIAAGGMAELFLARQWGDGGFFREVVVKRMFRNFAEHEPTLRMFHFEARLLAELNHPNIPQVTDLGWAGGTWYMAMEHVEGFNVADLWRAGVRSGHVMPLHVALGIVMQTCEALHHAHERMDRAGNPLRIVHRDVTPHNIMVTRDGVVKLTDFGVAQTAAHDEAETGAAKGTVSYMPPEQVRARTVDRRADVFALGVVLYELTTGTRLYPGNYVQAMTAIVEQDAPPPSTRVAGYPEELEAIVLWALQRDVNQRLPTAGHLAAYLESFALRYGMMVGPRGVASYFDEVFPAERVHQDDAGLVQPRRLELASEWDDMQESMRPRRSGAGRSVPPPPDVSSVAEASEPIYELDPNDVSLLDSASGEADPDRHSARDAQGSRARRGRGRGR